MAGKRRSESSVNILELFVDPLFGAFGGLLFVFLLAILLMGVQFEPAPLAIVTDEVPMAFANSSYRTALAAEGGLGSYRWSLAGDSALPAGLELDPVHGVICGAPEPPPSQEQQRTVTVTVEVVAEGLEGLPKQSRQLEFRLFRDVPNDLYVPPPLKIMTDAPLPETREGASYALRLAAIGGAPPYEWSVSSGRLPAGLTLTTAGSIVGSPELGSAGKYEFVVSAVDSRGQGARGSQDAKTLRIDVLAKPRPPSLELVSAGLPAGTIGQLYIGSFCALGGVPPYVWRVEGLPPGLEIDGSCGFISGRPSVAGDFALGVTVEDSSGARTSLETAPILAVAEKQEAQTVESYEISEMQILSQGLLPDAVQGRPYRVQLAAYGGVPPYSWAMTTTSTGLSLSSGGHLSGLLGQDHPPKIELQVTVHDARPVGTLGASSSSIAFLPVVESTPEVSPLRILTPPRLPSAIHGFEYSLQLAAQGGTAPYAWEITSGVLPPGLRLTTNGLLTGPVPAGSLGDFSFESRVWDSRSDRDGTSDQREFVITVPPNSPPSPLLILTQKFPSAILGQPYLAAPSGEGGVGPYDWDVSGLPEGLSFDESTHQISGSPTVQGKSSVSLVLSDSTGLTATTTTSVELEVVGPVITWAQWLFGIFIWLLLLCALYIANNRYLWLVAGVLYIGLLLAGC